MCLPVCASSFILKESRGLKRADSDSICEFVGRDFEHEVRLNDAMLIYYSYNSAIRLKFSQFSVILINDHH